MIVPTSKPFTSMLLEATIKSIVKYFPFIYVSKIGTSRMGRPIYALTLGHGGKNVLINAAHHANEWITSVLLMKFLEECAAQPAWTCVTTLHIVPMVNPDGVDLVTGGLGFLRPIYKNAKAMAGDLPFPKCWKANAIGVDLNSNYPANWEEARRKKFEMGYTVPGPRDYVGAYPLSEPESNAMAMYTIANDFDLTISLHTQGEEIFWQYENYNPAGAAELAAKFSKASGYQCVDVPPESSHAGYRDWFIQTFNRPGFTIECGLGENPLPIFHFDSIYKKIAPLLWEALL